MLVLGQLISKKPFLNPYLKSQKKQTEKEEDKIWTWKDLISTSILSKHIDPLRRTSKTISTKYIGPVGSVDQMIYE